MGKLEKQQAERQEEKPEQCFIMEARSLLTRKGWAAMSKTVNIAVEREAQGSSALYDWL